MTSVFLDAGPLGLACKGLHNAKANACRDWIANLEAQGNAVLIAEISDYEVRREFLRLDATDMLARLDFLTARRWVPLTREAIRRAAEFWALVRQQGSGTADPRELDCDALLAAQARTATRAEDAFLIATDNIGHLHRFPGVVARPWDQIALPPFGTNPIA